MKKLTTIEEDRKQAKMTFNTKEEVIIKLPISLSLEDKKRIRTAFLKIYSSHWNSPYPLKVAYKPGAPIMFVNRSGKENSTETIFSYKIADLCSTQQENKTCLLS